MIITIDGSAGSGKSTVARKLAKKLGLIHLNSGALFRAIALKAEQAGVSFEDEAGISSLAADTHFMFQRIQAGLSAHAADTLEEDSAETVLLVDGKDVSAQLHTARAGKLASGIAVLPKLRELLLCLQREEAKRHTSLVVEGRDAGTVVFPAAAAKFFLDASLEERAKRRFAQLSGSSLPREAGAESPSLEELQTEMDARDQRDRTRELAPQVPASDAEVIDSSALTADEVVALICVSLERRGLNPA